MVFLAGRNIMDAKYIFVRLIKFHIRITLLFAGWGNGRLGPLGCVRFRLA